MMAVKVKSILVEGRDGNEYLLGIGPRSSGHNGSADDLASDRSCARLSGRDP